MSNIISIHLLFLAASFFLLLFTLEDHGYEYYYFSIRGAAIVNIFILYVTFLYFFLCKILPINYKISTYIGLSSKYRLLTIINLTIALIILRIFMFYMSIGITGVAPPLLPFKISGILTYLASIVIPVAIFYVFIFSRHIKSAFVAIYIQIVMILCSCLAASRSLIFISGIILFLIQFRLKKFILAFILLYISIIGFHLSTEMRDLIYQYDYNGVYVEPSLFNFYDLYNKIYDFNFFNNLKSIINRFSGLDNLYNSVNYNVNIVENPYNYVSRLIYINYNISPPFGNHNIQWFGYEIPGGLYDGPTQLNASIVLFNHITIFLLYGFVISLNFFISSKLINCINADSLILKLIRIIFSFILMFSIGTIYYYAAIIILLIFINLNKFNIRFFK